MRWKCLILFTLFYVSCQTTSWGATSPPPLLQTKLSNGLQLIVKENHAAPMVAVQVFIKTGVLHETKAEAGITSFTQQLLLKGTKHRSAKQLATELETLGGTIHVSTEPDFSTITLVILKENLASGLSMLTDILEHASFPKEEVEKERSETLLALASRYDNPFTQAYDLFLKTLYVNHPYGRPAIGEKESIKKLSRQNLLHFYEKNYNAPNLIVTAVGDLEKKALTKTLSSKLASLPISLEARLIAAGGFYHQTPEKTKPNGTEKIPAPEGPTQSQTVSKARTGLSASWTLLGYLTTPVNHPDYPALKVLHSLLGGGMSSKLYVALREKQGLAYSLGSFFPSRKAASHFVLYAQSSPKNQKALLNGMKAELANLQENLPSEKELAEKKEALIGDYLADHQSMASQAWYLGWWELFGYGAAYDESYLDAIRLVTPADLKRVLNSYFNHGVSILLHP